MMVVMVARMGLALLMSRSLGVRAGHSITGLKTSG